MSIKSIVTPRNLAFLLPLVAMSGRAGASDPNISRDGVVTPTTVTYTFNSVGIFDVDNKENLLVTDPFTYSFNRADANFAPVKLQDVLVPFGRYTNLNVCFNTQVQIKIDGGIFSGHSNTAINSGDAIYTTSATNSAGAVSHTNPGTAVATTISVSTSAQNCAQNFSPKPLCITESGTTGCQPGDVVETAPVVQTADAGPQADVSFSIFLLLDLDHAVFIDSTTGQIQDVANVQVTVGQPGAAIHLSAPPDSDGNTADVGMLFGPDKSLLAVQAVKIYDASRPGMCDGSAAVPITAAPAGSPLPIGIDFIGLLNSSGTGDLQVPASGACEPGDTCMSNGVNHFTGFIQAVGESAAVTCGADSAATPPFLGYTYLGGPGGDGSTVTLPIVRIVDPGNIFGICDETHSPVAGATGTCSAVTGSTDGYQ